MAITGKWHGCHFKKGGVKVVAIFFSLAKTLLKTVELFSDDFKNIGN